MQDTAKFTKYISTLLTTLLNINLSIQKEKEPRVLEPNPANFFCSHSFVHDVECPESKMMLACFLFCRDNAPMKEDNAAAPADAQDMPAGIRRHTRPSEECDYVNIREPKREPK